MDDADNHGSHARRCAPLETNKRYHCLTIFWHSISSIVYRVSSRNGRGYVHKKSDIRSDLSLSGIYTCEVLCGKSRKGGKSCPQTVKLKLVMANNAVHGMTTT